MLNFGMVGMNEGNGHPYSFAASFNGYNEKNLEQYCDFPIIREYLKKHHRNQEFISEARISHIWTQDKELSRRVAEVSNIPHVAGTLDELAQKVDGIIFARDDMWNHWSMAGELFKTGKPVYMDKLLGHTPEDLKKFIAAIGRNYPLLTASSYQFAPNVRRAAESIDRKNLRMVRGVSPCIWVRYAPHLLGALFTVCGNKVASVQNCGRDREDSVCLTFENGMQAILQVFEGMALPLGLSFHFNAPTAPLDVPYTDPTLESYFLSIVEMMRGFTSLALTGRSPVPFADTLKTNAIVLAGIASREQHGRKISADEFMEVCR